MSKAKEILSIFEASDVTVKEVESLEFTDVQGRVPFEQLVREHPAMKHRLDKDLKFNQIAFWKFSSKRTGKERNIYMALRDNYEGFIKVRELFYLVSPDGIFRIDFGKRWPARYTQIVKIDR